MKALFRIMAAFQVWLYRVTGGKLMGRMFGFNVLLLTTKGRKSGKTHTTPLGSFEYNGGYVIVASNGGQDSNPAWYLNLKSNPQVTMQVMDRVSPASAEILSGEARQQAWQNVIAKAPSYAGYEKKTSRVIPLILLHPLK